MKERPILFSGPMVRAILAGQKTQTRRLVRLPRGVDPDHRMPQQASGRPDEFDALHWPGDDAVTTPLRSPYGAPGDRLWVRETWALVRGGDYNSFEGDYADLDFYETTTAGRRPPGYSTVWRADDGWDDYSREDGAYWRPSIHMPRWASRLSLEVESIRVEGLQGISEEDAKAEGVTPPGSAPPGFLDSHNLDADHTYRGAFAALWDSINGRRATWASNPWVWVIEFRRLKEVVERK